MQLPELSPWAGSVGQHCRSFLNLKTGLNSVSISPNAKKGTKTETPIKRVILFTENFSPN